jgi:hypothetical protein
MKNFMVGFVLGAFMFMAPASAIKTVVERMESELIDLAAGSSCRTAIVEDIDLWDRSMLISVKGLKFVMSAVNRSTYEICVVEDHVLTLDEARNSQ